MPFIELAAALYLWVQVAFISTEGFLNTAFLKAPVYIFAMVLFFDAMTRLGWLQ